MKNKIDVISFLMELKSVSLLCPFEEAWGGVGF